MENSKDSYKLECFSTGNSPLCESRQKMRKGSLSKTTTCQGSKKHRQSFDTNLADECCPWEGEFSSPPPPSGTFSPLTPSITQELTNPFVLEEPGFFDGSPSPNVKEVPFSLISEGGKNPPSLSVGYARGQSAISGFESSSRVRLSSLRRNGISSFSCTIWERKLNRSIPHVCDSRTRVAEMQCSLQADSTSTVLDSKSNLNCITLEDVERVVSFVMERILYFVS